MRSTREPAHNVDQLGVRDVGRIAEFVDRVRIRKPAQADELADPLSPVQVQLGPPVGEEEAPKLAVTEQIIENLRDRHRLVGNAQRRARLSDGGQSGPYRSN